MNPSPSFDDRYGPNWPAISRLARSLTDHQCVLCRAPATETHHALYADRDGAIQGREIPGVHVFPLCLDCHQSDGGAHDPTNWHGDRHNPVLGNHQRPSYYQRLRSGWVAIVHNFG